MTEDAPKPKTARPWDLFISKYGRVEEQLQVDRMEICKGCPFFIGLTKQCTKCGCFMPAKTKLPHAQCPLDPPKWFAVNVSDYGNNSSQVQS